MTDQPSFFVELKQLILEYFEAKIRLLKLEACEKIAKVSASLVTSILIVVIIVFMFFFLNLAAGFFFGELLHSNAYGFLIIFGIYSFVLIMIAIFRKNLLERLLINKIIKLLFEKERKNG